MKAIATLLRNSRGATAIEYALIASLISIAGISGFISLGSSVDEMYTNVENAM